MMLTVIGGALEAWKHSAGCTRSIQGRFEAHAWLDQFRRFWEHKLDALETEIARGKRKRRRAKQDE
jgi:hypothetical protein